MTVPDKANLEASVSAFDQGPMVYAGALAGAIRQPVPVCVIGTVVYDNGSRHEFTVLPGDRATIDLRGSDDPIVGFDK